MTETLVAPSFQPLLALDGQEFYFIAIGGTGMAPLACLLKELGHRVRGSDGPLYPPMSELLAAAGIEPFVGYDPDHLEPPPDLVVVGNAVPRSNPEAVEAERLDLPRLSMPEALYRFCMADRRRLVVAGTHGKTTTTSMAAVALSDLGEDPGYLIGGVPVDLPGSFRFGGGRHFLVEGDEYNAAYFDRGPKFLHYRPDVLLLTSAEHDHVDLYPEPEQFRLAFAALVALVPEDGVLVACGDLPEVRELAAGARCRVLYYGLDGDNAVRPIGEPREGATGGLCCRVVGPAGEAELTLTVPGRHNLVNALGVWAAACAEGLDPRAAAASLSRFSGVLRRLQELGTAAGVTVVDDFAHHPTAVAASLAALRRRYPGRRLVAAFEPRSLSAARRMFHDAYRDAFAVADRLLLAPVFYAQRLPADERLDVSRLAAELGAGGTPTAVTASIEALREQLLAEITAGDVVACMSSGSFEDLPRRLLQALRQREAAARPQT